MRCLAFVVVIGALDCGCANIPTVLPPKARQQVQQVSVRSYIAQDSIHVAYKLSKDLEDFGIGGYGNDLLSVAAFVYDEPNSIKDDINSDKAAKRTERITDVVRDCEFRSPFWEMVSNMSVTIPWLNAQSFMALVTQYQLYAPRFGAREPELNMNTDYRITPDCRKFEVVTELTAFLPGNYHVAAATNTVTYLSARIVDAEGDKAMDAWVANSGAAYRRAVGEGIIESERLLRRALNIMGGSTDPGAKPAYVKTDFGTVTGRKKLKGLILEESPGRVIFQAAGGGLFSLPTSEAEVTYK